MDRAAIIAAYEGARKKTDAAKIAASNAAYEAVNADGDKAAKNEASRVAHVYLAVAEEEESAAYDEYWGEDEVL